jgi:protein SCO1/2
MNGIAPETARGVRRGPLLVFILLGAGATGAAVNVAHHWAGADYGPRPGAGPLAETEEDDDEFEEPKLKRPKPFEDVPDIPDPPGPLEVFEAAKPTFALIDQDGLPLSDRDLLGRVWVLDFVYTNCSGPCPRLSQSMSALHREVDDPRVVYVTATCDPDRDPPSAMRDYAETYQADTARWKFLTGDRKVVRKLAHGVLQADSEDDPLLHSVNLILIDAQGRMRGYYDGRSPNMMKRLQRHLRKLLAEEPPPVAASRPASAPASRENSR